MRGGRHSPRAVGRPCRHERRARLRAGAAAFLFIARRGLVVSLLGAVLGGLTGAYAHALASRLFPNELSTDVFGGYRLFTPVGYRNGLGLLAATGARETPLG